MIEFTTLKNREENVLFNTYLRYPIAICRGSGTKLYDFKGKEYTDLLAGIAVCNLGHSHPELIEVICEQAKKLIHVSNLFYTEEQLELAEKLLSFGPFEKVFFCNSGAEANEAAIKLARRYMQKIRGEHRYEIITLEGSFHGRTLATLSATGQEKVKDGFSPLVPGFKTVKINNLAELEKEVTQHTAAVMIELIQGEGGIRPLDPEYIYGISEICKKYKILLIIDEIQTGMGRTGKMWAFQHYSITPDIITCAKALANGLPMGAMMATEEVAKGFGPGTHATTFGGGPLVSKVALKVLEILQRDKLILRADEIGKYSLKLFENLRQNFPDLIKQVRGKGLMIGIELDPKLDAKHIFQTLLSRGFILNLTQERVLRLLPPLIISKEEISDFCDELKKVITK